MIRRAFWLQRLERAWSQRSIIWLSGVRRVGKTTLARQIEGARYFSCDLPSVRRQLADPESFFANLPKRSTIILDEVHRLEDPSATLKIAADEFGHLRVLATGSSTLEATTKFRDSLTDRRRTLFLPPVLWIECPDPFGTPDLERRLLNGGLPSMLLSPEPVAEFFEDWQESFYARDVQELFGVRNRIGFLKLLELLVLRSGGQLDITDLSKESGLSRPTAMAHLEALEIAHAVSRLPPYHGGGTREIVRQPKVYAFDTGFVAHLQGWDKLDGSRAGRLWEQLVLDHLRVHFPHRSLHHWRDKSQREVDFVVERRLGEVDAIEAKLSPEATEGQGLAAFRKLHPQGANYFVCPHVREPYRIQRSGLRVSVVGLEHYPPRSRTER